MLGSPCHLDCQLVRNAMPVSKMIPTFPVKCLASETTQLSVSVCFSGAWLLAGPSPGVLFLLPGQLCVAREPGGMTGVTYVIGDGRRREGVDCRQQTRKKQRSGGALLIDNQLIY